MPRRVGTRSQRPSQGSQRPPTQTQGGGGRSSRSQPQPAAEEDDEEQEDEEADDEEEGHGHQMNVGDEDDENGGDSDLKRKANDLVRIALFTEHKRVPLRREDITKKVLGGNGRTFNRVFEHAQKKLKTTFGMELVELPSRAGLEQEASAAAADEDDLNEARKATGIKKKTAAFGSKTYILRSCLSPLLIEHAALTDEQILEEEAVDMPSDDDSYVDGIDEGGDDDDRPPRSYGSIISWSHSEQVGPLGILHVVLALILVSGRAMTDADLRTQLKRLHLPSTPGRSPVHFTTPSTVRSMSMDQYLALLQRQGFLDRQIVGDTAGPVGKKSGGNKRMRATQPSKNDDDNERQMYEWKWGNRAMCEVGEEAVARFVSEFMVGRGSEDDGAGEEGGAAVAGGSNRRRAGNAQEGGTANARNGREEKVKKMLAGVEKAAGGKLAQLK